jgi:hypothetical protein
LSGSTSHEAPSLHFGRRIELAIAPFHSAAAQSGTAMPRSALADPIANEGVIEDGAVDAIKEMSNF